jgi:hypothetical protein
LVRPRRHAAAVRQLLAEGDSQRGADQKEILDARLPNSRGRTFLADNLRYLLKSPKNAYRIYKTARITCDGECAPCLRQRKSELRKGDRITLFHLLKNLHFPGWQLPAEKAQTSCGESRDGLCGFVNHDVDLLTGGWVRDL